MRVAIITGSAGGGHNTAARNLLESAPSGTEVKIFQLEDYLTKTNRRLFISSYDYISTFAKGFLWRFVYRASNTRPGMWAYKITLTEFLATSRRSVSHAISEFKPEAIISTIFYGPFFLNKEFSQTPKYTIITDFGFHRVWYHPSVFHYFTGNEQIVTDIEKINTAVKVSITGIPVSDSLYQKNQTKSLIYNDKPKILLLAGGTGLMRIDNYLSTLLSSTDQWSITVICGDNPSLVKKVKTAAGKQASKIEIIGWTDKLTEYLKRSDIVVTKPGGLSSSECLAAGKFMILVSPIPGQEEANAKFLINKNCAVLVEKPADLPGAITEVLQTITKKNQTVFPVRSATESIWEIITQNN